MSILKQERASYALAVNIIRIIMTVVSTSTIEHLPCIQKALH